MESWPCDEKPLYAPDTFKCSTDLTAENQRKICWVPFTAQIRHDIDLQPATRKMLLLEAHAVDKTLLRCTWLLKYRQPPTWTSAPIINYTGSPDALVVKEKIYLVAVEGQPERDFGELLRKRLEGCGTPILLIPKDFQFESSSVRARALLSQSHEGLLETIRVYVPRRGRVVVTAEEPLRTFLEFCDVLQWQLARLPTTCPLLVYGQNLRNSFAAIDGHFYTHMMQETGTSDTSKFRQGLVDRLNNNQIEIIPNAVEARKRLEQGSVLLFLLCTPEEFITELNQVDANNISAVQKSPCQVWSADPSLMDWNWRGVAESFVSPGEGSAVLIRLLRSREAAPPVTVDLQLVDLPLPTPLAWQMGQTEEQSVKEVEVDITDQVLWPLTSGPNLLVATFIKEDQILSGPKTILVNQLSASKHEFVNLTK